VAPPEDMSALAGILQELKDTPGALLPILHGVQDAYGHIPPQAVPIIARALNLSRAEVHGVVTYYHHFREQPAGRCVVQICRAEACQALGSEVLAAHAEHVLQCAFHETRRDEAVSLEPVYCLGQCAIGPAMQVGETLYGRVTTRRFDEIMSQTLAVSA